VMSACCLVEEFPGSLDDRGWQAGWRFASCLGVAFVSSFLHSTYIDHGNKLPFSPPLRIFLRSPSSCGFLNPPHPRSSQRSENKRNKEI